MRVVEREDGMALVAGGNVDLGGHARGKQGDEDVAAHVGMRSLMWAFARWEACLL